MEEDFCLFCFSFHFRFNLKLPGSNSRAEKGENTDVPMFEAIIYS